MLALKVAFVSIAATETALVSRLETGSAIVAVVRLLVEAGAELVLVSGFSGIGKSSVVHELHKVLIQPRGLYASGKFDQYKRDIPYGTLAEAFQSLVVKVDVGDLDVVEIERVGVDREAVIVGGDLDFLG